MRLYYMPRVSGSTAPAKIVICTEKGWRGLHITPTTTGRWEWEASAVCAFFARDGWRRLLPEEVVPFLAGDD